MSLTRTEAVHERKIGAEQRVFEDGFAYLAGTIGRQVVRRRFGQSPFQPVVSIVLPLGLGLDQRVIDADKIMPAYGFVDGRIAAFIIGNRPARDRVGYAGDGGGVGGVPKTFREKAVYRFQYPVVIQVAVDIHAAPFRDVIRLVIPDHFFISHLDDFRG
ncbi:hypothetical protein D1872_246060 [compost metagenome]